MSDLVVLAFFGVLYVVPTLVATIRQSRNTGSIAVVNLLLGWTILGWVGALAWAVAEGAKPAVPPSPEGQRWLAEDPRRGQWL
ncbi:membrane protein [Gordonia phage Nedarya]|nr:membrane protein [Gordonia phage Nedarya]